MSVDERLEVISKQMQEMSVSNQELKAISNREVRHFLGELGSKLARSPRAIKHGRASLPVWCLLVFLCSCCELLGFFP